MADENPGGGGGPVGEGDIDSGVPPPPADEGGGDAPPDGPPPAEIPLADPPPGVGEDKIEGGREDGGKYEPSDSLDTEPTLPDQGLTDEPEPEQEKPFVLPIYIYTAIFGAIFLFGPLLARRGPNVGITRCCIMISAFCCWIFWTTTYIVQMNPLLGPRMGNETLAWIGHKWGKNALYVRDFNETTESEDAAKTAPRQVLDGEKAADPLAAEKAMAEELQEKAESKELEEPPKEEPPKEEPPKDEPVPEEPPNEETDSRRRFNGTNLFTNLTHLIRD